jgi:hypothetical protein
VALGLDDVMHCDQRRATTLAMLVDAAPDQVAALGVEARGRLVEQRRSKTRIRPSARCSLRLRPPE